VLHTKKHNDPSACDVNVKYWPGSVDAVSVTVRPATKTDVPAGATVLADAFFDDPVMAWMWPDEGRREHGLRRYFAAEARFHSVPVGGADIAERDEIVGGAALWGPPVHGSRRYGSRFACGPGSRSHSAVTRAPESPSALHSRQFIPPNRTGTSRRSVAHRTRAEEDSVVPYSAHDSTGVTRRTRRPISNPARK